MVSRHRFNPLFWLGAVRSSLGPTGAAVRAANAGQTQAFDPRTMLRCTPGQFAELQTTGYPAPLLTLLDGTTAVIMTEDAVKTMADIVALRPDLTPMQIFLAGKRLKDIMDRDPTANPSTDSLIGEQNVQTKQLDPTTAAGIAEMRADCAEVLKGFLTELTAAGQPSQVFLGAMVPSKARPGSTAVRFIGHNAGQPEGMVHMAMALLEAVSRHGSKNPARASAAQAALAGLESACLAEGWEFRPVGDDMTTSSRPPKGPTTH